MTATLPPSLIEAVRSQQAILFLGAGASFGALHPQGVTIPLGDELRDKISDLCLDGKLKDRPLQQVAELAVNLVGMGPFQLHLRDLFKDFQPAPHHLLIPRFRWHAIVTTNVDLIVERAYEQAPQVYGQLVIWLKDGQLFDLEARIQRDSANQAARVRRSLS